ncbi:MAG: pyruvate dehydrogenase (acetyl-transferring) E1 component subunit alpha [Chitinophagales bacterium]|nr:pyruvate dehydrogenase (acetyl-transferring) E1 component subunit alpha [Chitinophagales bacterium]
MAKISKETYLEWYELMLLLRKFEEKAGQLYGMQKIRGFCHLYIGQEAVAAGLHSSLRADDNIITGYRDHGLAIMKGMTANEVMAELYGKATGSTKGKGGSMHYFSKDHRFFGGHGIVGGQIGLGTGIAFADKYNDTDRVTVAMFGDGASRQGMLHEVFNMAMLWKLPVIFICENNKYAMGTSVERTSNVTDLSKLGLGYEMPSYNVDGMKPEAVHEAMDKAIARARKGLGPTYLNIMTYRYKGHSMSDPQKYRTKEEVNEYLKIDPIETTKELILSKKYATEAQIDKINQKIKDIVEESVEFAENSPWPSNDELYKDIYVQEDYPFLID